MGEPVHASAAGTAPPALDFPTGTAYAMAGVMAVTAPLIEWWGDPGPGLHPYTWTSAIIAPALVLAAWLSRSGRRIGAAQGLVVAATLAAFIVVGVAFPQVQPGGLIRPVAVLPLWIAAALLPMPAVILALGAASVALTVVLGWNTPDANLALLTVSHAAAASLAVGISYGWRKMRLSTLEAARLENVVAHKDIERAAVARFVRYAAHELRTPLTPLRLLPSILRDAGTKPSVRDEQLVRAERMIERLTAIVDRLGVLASLESESTAVEGDVARQVLVVAQEDPRITVEAPARAATTVSDAGVHAILSELANNARLAANDRIRIRVLDDGEAWKIAVDDDGPGVPPEAHAALLQPFGRVMLDVHPHERSGLGLALVDAMTAAVGGDVELQASDLGGLRAVVRLPKGTPPGARPPRRTP